MFVVTVKVTTYFAASQFGVYHTIHSNKCPQILTERIFSTKGS